MDQQKSHQTQKQQLQKNQKVYSLSLSELQNIQPMQKKKGIKCGIREGCQDINNYRRLNRIHEGVYGVVYRAEDTITKQVYAIKKLKLNSEQDFPITSLREIAILKTIDHENIIKIHKISGNAARDRVYIVMEYMEHEIKAILKMPIVFTEPQVRRLMKDLLLGIDSLHQKNIVHRDLKTSNLLYSNDGILKICDFGLARRISSLQMTQQVVSLWYRAPELLFGPVCYSTEIDMWSVGCIFGQLLLGDGMFQGETDISQLDKIFQVVGTPNDQNWPGFKQLANARYIIGKKYPNNRLREKIPKDKLSDSGLDLLNKLLTPYPKKRITADKALKHDWFKGVISERVQMPTCVAINEMDRVQKMVKV